MVTIDLVLERLKRVRKNARGYLAQCPAHDDRGPSLSVTTSERGILLHCFAGCTAESVAEKLGVRMTDLFTEPPRGADVVQLKRNEPRYLTLEDLAAHKHIPASFLAGFHCTTATGGWGSRVEIPYPTREGAAHRTRYRSALVAKEGSSWGPGDSLIPYMPDRGALADAEGYAFVVEGESDVWTLLYAGFPAIGIPGATSASILRLEHVRGLARLLIVQETDSAGEKFVQLTRAHLAEIGFEGEVITFHCPGTAKDPSSLYIRNPDTFAEAMRTELARVTAPPEPRWRLLADAIPDLLRPLGPRLTTGFPELDRCTRGGFPRGRFIVVSGAPGAAKTTLAVNLARTFEWQAETVLYLAADEPASGIAMRIGQMFGFHREGLEEDSDIGEATRAGFVDRMRGHRFVVMDPDLASLTLEDAAECLHEARGGPGGILIVDSLQTVRCAAAQAFDKPRERMDAVVLVCKRIAQRGAVVVALSEMNRGGYTGEKTSALGASKESSAIEYGASVLLGMTRVPFTEATADFDIEVAKNRLGGERPTFRVRLDLATAELAEVTRPKPEQIAAKRPGKLTPLQKVRAVLENAVRPMTGNEVVFAAGAAKAAALQAIADMRASGELRELQGGIWLVTRPDPE
jgi:KaiC/GvpD/RAD55 family RecA-like ATPase